MDKDINMKRSRLANQGLSLSAFCMITTTVYAGIPMWGFSPNGSPVVTLNATGTATTSYTVTNHSKKPYRLVLSSETPSGISQVGGPCVLAGKSSTTPNPTCTLTLSVNGSALPANTVSGGPILCQANGDGTPNLNRCYQPSPANALAITRIIAPNTTTLSTSVPPPSILALSVNNTSLNPALMGHTRQITITNTGTDEATGLNITYPAWPGGTTATTASSTCGTTLAPGDTCTITINPGSDATSNCATTGTAPTPGTITVSATNVATAVTSNVVILSYGCQYQGGFLYSVDDTTNHGVTGACLTSPCVGSIGGKVASLVDQVAPNTGGSQATGIIWSSNGRSMAPNFSYDIIPFISIPISTSPDSYVNAQSTFDSTYSNANAFPFPESNKFAACDGASDGSCNSRNILALYDAYKTGYGANASFTLSAGPTSRTDYAAGLCAETINGYSGWYLPAICEMDAVSGGVICPAEAQSMVVNLVFLLGNPNVGTPSTSCNPPSSTDCLVGDYWSSTQSSSSVKNSAWAESFASGGSSAQFGHVKLEQLSVRCSRALTL